MMIFKFKLNRRLSRHVSALRLWRTRSTGAQASLGTPFLSPDHQATFRRDDGTPAGSLSSVLYSLTVTVYHSSCTAAADPSRLNCSLPTAQLLLS